MIASHRRAKEIMGKGNFFGIEETVKFFRINPTRQQMSDLSRIPYDETIMEELNATHFLFASLPISVVVIRRRNPKLFYNYDEPARNPWYLRETFAQVSGETAWHLVRKTEIPNSTLRNWVEQKSLLRGQDCVPSARIMIYAVVTRFLSTGERMLEWMCVRTSSTDAGNRHIDIGRFNEHGLSVHALPDNHRVETLGVASARLSKVEELAIRKPPHFGQEPNYAIN